MFQRLNVMKQVYDLLAGLRRWSKPMKEEGTMTVGRKTTEFWLTLAVNAVAIAVAMGVVGTEDAEGVKQAVQRIAPAIVALVTNALYIWSRVRVKEAAAKANGK